MDIVAKTDGQVGHELCPRSDAVAIKVRLLRLGRRQLKTLGLQLLTDTSNFSPLLAKRKLSEYLYDYPHKL